MVKFTFAPIIWLNERNFYVNFVLKLCKKIFIAKAVRRTVLPFGALNQPSDILSETLRINIPLSVPSSMQALI